MAELLDFAFPFQLDAYGSVVSKTGGKLVIDLVEQILLTSLGERVYRPTFGSDLNRFIFEPVDVPIDLRRAELISEIRTAITNSESVDGQVRMQIMSIDVQINGETTEVFLSIRDAHNETHELSFQLP